MTSSAWPTRGDDVKVEVLRAWPHRFESRSVELAEGATLAQAVAVAGMADDPGIAGYAVHGVLASADTVLADGDRVELLRPLLLDPKEARRRRAQKKGA